MIPRPAARPSALSKPTTRQAAGPQPLSTAQPHSAQGRSPQEEPALGPRTPRTDDRVTKQNRDSEAQIPEQKTAPPTPAASRLPSAYESDSVGLWASSVVTHLLDGEPDPPAYGSPAWCELANRHPRKRAAIITAAESWRRYGCDDVSIIEAALMWRDYASDEVVTWLKEASVSHRPIADRRTLAELDAAAKPQPPHVVQAVDGWPPVAIPGRPGWHRHLINGEQVDLQDARGAAA